jgi:GH18 family chitinase
MKRTFTTLILFWTLWTAHAQQFKVVGYVANWINMTNFANNFDFSKVTHINIAFKNPSAAGNLPPMTSDEQYFITKAHQNNVKVFLSIGGGAISSNASWINRYDNLMAPANLTNFVGKLTRYSVNNNLDGLDIDLEGDAIDPDLYGPFIEELHDSLALENKLITCALSQGYGAANVPDYALFFFDWINIMAYDATGPWGGEGHHSTYNFAVSNINYWKNRGLPKSKCVLGLPFYGYGFDAAFSNNGYQYKDIVASYAGADQKDTIGNTIYYNGIPTIEAKTILAMNQGGGVMIWELSQDASGNSSLLKAINETMVLSNQESLLEDSKIQIFPNPAQDNISISTDLRSYTITLSSLEGKILFSGKNTEQLPLQDFPKGIYVISLHAEEGSYYRKITIY